MIRLVHDFRLIPVVLVATVALLALKMLGLVFDGGYLFADLSGRSAEESDITGSIDAPKRPDAAPPELPPPPRAAPSWAQQMFNFPDVTGSVGAAPAPPPGGAAKGDRAAPKTEPAKATGGTLVAIEPGHSTSPAERAILERLQDRRNTLEGRARELDMREGLLRAAEKRLEERVGELKDLEGRVNAAVQMKEEGEAARFKNLVTMYDNMKAKDAAKIFDRLDMRILVEVATQLNPRRMSDILALMAPEGAERLTIELATRARDRPATPELPKIEGRPPPR
jgi:flagellar motility protein MotE (MotC chaperone)